MRTTSTTSTTRTKKTKTKATKRTRTTTTEPREPSPEARHGARQTPERPFALGLGANLPRGERSAAATLQHTIHALGRHLGPLRAASLYRSGPLLQTTETQEPAAPDSSPPPDYYNPDYYNTVVTGSTNLSPDGLLALAKAFERAAGRNADDLRRDAPRPLDIDLLLYGAPNATDSLHRGLELTLPHPRLRTRRFVLEPLAELLPEWPLPPDGRTASELLPEVADQRVERCPWPLDLTSEPP